MIELSNCLWVPVARYTAQEIAALRKELTVTVRLLTGEAQEVCALQEDREGYLGLPRVYGMKLISQNRQKVYDMRSVGDAVRFPKQVALRDYQIPVVADMLTACSTKTDFIVRAGTGRGKTVMALAAIAKRGRKAAVVVDQENLLDQWIDRAQEHLGLRREDIGIVRGPKVEYKGKKLVICMIQSLIRKDLDEDFTEAFGTVVFDESHSAGAFTYSKALMIFPAEARFGLSATPDRRDSFRKLIEWNLGTVDVALDAEHHSSNLYVLRSYGTYSWRANNSKMASRFISEIADDGERNLLIAKAIVWLYSTGRDVLVIGDRVEQLASLRALCYYLGLPLDDLGMYSKVNTVWVYEKDPRPARRPYGWEKGTDYTPVRLALVQKTLRKDTREAVKENCRVIFSTYGIMSKGVDVPRLSAGIDATPRREATQTVGRILRVAPGKQRPIWVTVADYNSFRALFQLQWRLRDYSASNAEAYLWDMTKGRKKLDVAEYRDLLSDRVSLLQRSKIVTTLDGNNTLLIPDTPTDNDRRPASRTGRNTR